ncbi:MAG: fluoride efflux transporter CrcB [Verrucomicrobia bacterium]|nr:fluoride efflux transporter CrcB [Verrucomicrobiota bacterium]
MANYFFIALGSAFGGVLRFWLGNHVQHDFGGKFPLGTLVVNVSGSFLIGLFFALTADDGRLAANATWRNFLMVGICGGYTTFSAFSLQTLNLMREGEWLSVSLNVLLSVALCLVAVWLGHWTAQVFNR